MKAFVITLRGHEYSERVASRCIDSGASTGGIGIERFDAIPKADALSVMAKRGIRWTWGSNNVLRHHPYPGELASRVGCSMSHFLLWELCAATEPLLILEHDAVFVGAFEPFEFAGVCQVNDPDGATPRGKWWSEQMVKRGPGVFPKTRVLDDPRPDGLAGNSAYVLKPHAAAALIAKVHEVGMWPNDALMCRQFFPWLEERFPFVTRVEQSMSTTSA